VPVLVDGDTNLDEHDVPFRVVAGTSSTELWSANNSSSDVPS